MTGKWQHLSNFAFHRSSADNDSILKTKNYKQRWFSQKNAVNQSKKGTNKISKGRGWATRFLWFRLNITAKSKPGNSLDNKVILVFLKGCKIQVSFFFMKEHSKFVWELGYSKTIYVLEKCFWAQVDPDGLNILTNLTQTGQWNLWPSTLKQIKLTPDLRPFHKQIFILLTIIIKQNIVSK